MTVAELLEPWAEPADKSVRFGIIRRLLPDQLGYLVPLGPAAATPASRRSGREA
jgi:hypothetical protein